MFPLARCYCVAALCVGVAAGDAPAVPAFSGAEGFGAITGGGRGGSVIHVTNLDDSGPGSFRAAVTASGPRTVVFDVAGQINLTSAVRILNPYLTIAGQTAPGGGVTIAGETVSIDTHDAIVRYIRFRRGNTTREDDALGSDRTNSNDLSNPKTGNIIVDHVSASWGLDENLSVYRSKLNAAIVPGGSTVLPTRNVTLQWSISSEALNTFAHAFGSTLGGAGVNQHHNLWASNTGRNPSISFSHFMDFRNNVLFNWQHRSVDGAGPEAHVNMVNNYYKAGPATNSGQLQYRIVKPELRNGVVGYGQAGWWYVEGNYVNGYPAVTANNWAGGVQFDLAGMQESWVRSTTPHTHVEFPDDTDDPFDDDGSQGLGRGNPLPIPDLPTIATQTAQDAFASVLAGAGASLARDAVDLRVTNMVATGIVSGTPNGIINAPSQVGGYPTIPFVARDAAFDTDQDGMPNAWEAAHGLDANDAADRNADFDADGYTNLEDYLNDIGAFQAVQPIVWDNTLGNNRYANIENWDIAFQPSRFDTAVIRSGTAVIDAVGQHAGILQIAPQTGDAATVNLIGGALTAGTLEKGAGGAFNFTGGTLHAGTVNFDLVNNGGTLAPGGSIGTTHVTGDLTLTSGALEIEIGGTQVGQFDRVEVDGLTTLGGTLKVEFIELSTGPYVPQAGDTFGFLAAYGGDSGMFDAFDLPPLAAGLQWALMPGDATMFLAIVPAPLPGDYNSDGAVDAADYVVWRKTDGTPEGFNIWRANFGATVGSGSAVDTSSLIETGIPEPTTLVPLLLATMLRIARRPTAPLGRCHTA